jgi:6-phosphofructokinase 1
MGAAATGCIARNEFGVLVGLLQGEITTTPLAEVVGKQKSLDPDLLRLATVLAK